MLDKKFWQKVFSFVLIAGVILLTTQQVVQANKTIGIVGLESRTNALILSDYTDIDDLRNSPLVIAQDVFEETLTNRLPLLKLSAANKTAYAKRVIDNETEIQASQQILSNSISALEKGDTSQALKIFDETPDYLIYGYIANLTVTHRESVATSNLAVQVKLTARVIDAKTGKLIYLGIGKGKSSNHGGAYRKPLKLGGEEIDPVCWSEAIKEASIQLVKDIKTQM